MSNASRKLIVHNTENTDNKHGLRNVSFGVGFFVNSLLILLIIFNTYSVYWGVHYTAWVILDSSYFHDWHHDDEDVEDTADDGVGDASDSASSDGKDSDEANDIIEQLDNNKTDNKFKKPTVVCMYPYDTAAPKKVFTEDNVLDNVICNIYTQNQDIKFNKVAFKVYGPNYSCIVALDFYNPTLDKIIRVYAEYNPGFNEKVPDELVGKVNTTFNGFNFVAVVGDDGVYEADGFFAKYCGDKFDKEYIEKARDNYVNNFLDSDGNDTRYN